jgi:hypothetical protein
MENNKSAFGRSVSMPIFQQQREEITDSRNIGVAVCDEQYDALQQSPSFQTYRNQAAGVWSVNGNGFVRPLPRTYGVKNGNHATNGSTAPNDAPFGSDFDRKGTPSIMTDSSSSSVSSVDSEATIKPNKMNDLTNRLSTTAIRSQENANTAAAGTDSRPGIYASKGPSNVVLIKPEPKSLLLHSFVEDVGIIGQYHPNNKSSESSPGIETPKKNWLPGLEHQSPATDKTSPPKELYVPGGFGNHRRMASRVSSLSGLPARLHPQDLIDLSNDLSNRISLNSPSQSSPHSNVKYGKKPKKSAEKLDLHALKVSANAVGSPYHRKSFGLSHERKINDPFVDNTETGNESHMPSPFGAHPSENMQLPAAPGVQEPNTPTFQFPGSPSAQHHQRSTGTPNNQGFNSPLAQRDFRISNPPVYQPVPSGTLTNPTTPCADLSIPPPPLSSARSRLQHSPSTHARLDTRAPIREDWMRTQAAKIAELSRQSYAAEQQFRVSGTQEDLQLWQSLAAEFADTTSLDKRQEERRNMFMPDDMRAMRTGVENVGGDGSAAFGAGEGQLFGWKMAFMERIGAEMQRRKEEEEGEEITKDMLATLNKEEKMALRQYLTGRLKDATEARK